MPTRLGTAIVLASLDYNYRVINLMRRLNRGTAKYVRENEHMLDQFWVIMLPVKFSDTYIGNGPGAIHNGKLIKNEESFPTLDTKHVPPNYRLESIEWEHNQTAYVHSLRLTMSDGTYSRRLARGSHFDKGFEVPADARIAKVKCFGYYHSLLQTKKGRKTGRQIVYHHPS